MFKLFLKRKILSGEAPSNTEASGTGRRRNRRVFERFDVNHKHLVLLNEQDIFVIKEISAKGFSSWVSPRALERLNLGDMYDARMRYLGELYNLQIRVSWKTPLPDAMVGFEITKADRETLVFIRRILRPMEVALSLQEMPTQNAAQGEEKFWYHGDHDCDIYLWRDEASAISAWQFSQGNEFLQWDSIHGLTSGHTLASAGAMQKGTGHKHVPQGQGEAIDPERRQFAVDVLMAMSQEFSKDILRTLGV